LGVQVQFGSGEVAAPEGDVAGVVDAAGESAIDEPDVAVREGDRPAASTIDPQPRVDGGVGHVDRPPRLDLDAGHGRVCDRQVDWLGVVALDLDDVSIAKAPVVVDRDGAWTVDDDDATAEAIL